MYSEFRNDLSQNKEVDLLLRMRRLLSFFYENKLLMALYDYFNMKKNKNDDINI